MANIGKIGTKVMSGLNHASLSKYANNPEIYIKDTQHLFKIANVIISDKVLEDRVLDTFWRSGASLLGKRISGPYFLSGAVPAFLVRCRLLVGTDSGSRWVGRLYRRVSDAVLLSRVGGSLYSGFFVRVVATVGLETGEGAGCG